MIRVYLAEDNRATARLFQAMLQGWPDILVVGIACDGRQAIAELPLLKPDLLITDLWMPNVDGYALIEWVMAHQPMPILVLSDAVDLQGQEAVVRCLALGALEARAKPAPSSSEGMAQSRQQLVELVRTLSSVRPVSLKVAEKASVETPEASFALVQIVAIGASTGGPQVLHGLFSALNREFPVPILLAIHVAPSFLSGFVAWLKTITSLKIVEVTAETRLEAGCIYLPQEGHHLVAHRAGYGLSIPLHHADRYVPSVDRLFHSVALIYSHQACGILLTGMGRDGAEGLNAMRKAGAVTLAQDEASCAVYGMPAAAKTLGAVQRSLSPAELAAELRQLAFAHQRSFGDAL